MTASSSASQSQLDVAYKVSTRNLVLAGSSPPASGQRGDDTAPAQDETESCLHPIASPESTLPVLEMTSGEGADPSHTGTQAGDSSEGCLLLGSGSAPCGAESETRTVSRGSSCGIQTVSRGSSFGTQTYESSEAASSQEPVLFDDYVCKMCRSRTKVADRQKADLESMRDISENLKPEPTQVFRWGKGSGAGQRTANQTPEHTEPLNEWREEMTPAGEDSTEGRPDADCTHPVLPPSHPQLPEPAREPAERRDSSRHPYTPREIHVEIIHTEGPGGLPLEHHADKLRPQLAHCPLPNPGLVDGLEGTENHALCTQGSQDVAMALETSPGIGPASQGNASHEGGPQAAVLALETSPGIGPASQGNASHEGGPFPAHAEMTEGPTALQEAGSLLVRLPQHAYRAEDGDGARSVHSGASSQAALPEAMDFAEEGNEVTGSHAPHLIDPNGSHMPHLIDPNGSHVPQLIYQNSSHMSHLIDPYASYMSQLTDPNGSHTPQLTEPNGSHTSHVTVPNGFHASRDIDPDGAHTPRLIDPNSSHTPRVIDPSGSYTSHPYDPICFPASQPTDPTGSYDCRLSFQPLTLMQERGAADGAAADTGVGSGPMQAEETAGDCADGGATDALGCVLKWIEEASNAVRELLLSSGPAAKPRGSADPQADVTADCDVDDDDDDGGGGGGGGVIGGPQREQECQLEYVLVVLDFLARSVGHATSASSLTALTELLLLALCSAENANDLAPAAAEWLAASPLKFSALATFGRWLGEEFHRFEPTISGRVTEFKVKHINNISDLPPAAKVVDELFPPCMVALASTWIGLTDIQTAEATQMDHSYDLVRGGSATSSTSLLRHNRNLYPVIQLVLELLNNSLVSGMAHVVYCKLRHAS